MFGIGRCDATLYLYWCEESFDSRIRMSPLQGTEITLSQSYRLAFARTYTGILINSPSCRCKPQGGSLLQGTRTKDGGHPYGDRPAVPPPSHPPTWPTPFIATWKSQSILMPWRERVSQSRCVPQDESKPGKIAVARFSSLYLALGGGC